MPASRDVVLGKYELIHEINEGGNATVWKALHLIEDRKSEFVAVKILHNRPGEEAVIHQMFDNEVKVLKTLQGAQNIVKYFESGFDKSTNSYCIVEEYFAQNLAQLLEEQGPITDLEKWKKSAEQLISAVEVAHRRQIEHRDLKPENIMIRPVSSDEYELVLIDFGISNVKAEIPRNVTVREWHTPYYAPSDFMKYDVFARDLFAIAATMIRMLNHSEYNADRNLTVVFHGLKAAGVIPEPILNFIDGVIFPKPRPISSITEFKSRFLQAMQIESLHKAITIPVFLDYERVAAIVKLDPFNKGKQLLSSFRGNGVVALFKTLSGEVDSETVYLIKNQIELACAVKKIGEASYLKVFAVRQLDDQVNEIKCSNGKEIDTTEFKLTFGRDLETLGTATLRDLLEFLSPDSKLDKDSPELAIKMDLYRRMIDARKKIILGEGSEFKFTNVSFSGKRCVFTLENPSFIPEEGSNWEILGFESMSFEYVESEDASITLECSKAPANLPTTGKLVRSLGLNKASFRRQAEAIEKFTESGSSGGLLPRVFENPAAASLAPLDDDIEFLGDLDEPKKEAVKLGLESQDVCLVQGPPGTGKTQFIAELVHQISKASEGAKILLVSQTHVAVDNAIERLRKAGFDSIIRVGRDDKIGESAKDLVVDRKLEVWRDEVKNLAETYMSRICSSLGVEVGDLEKACLLLDLVDATKPKVNYKVVRNLKTALSVQIEEENEDSEIQGPIDVDLDEQSEMLIEKLSKLGYKANVLKEQIKAGKAKELFDDATTNPSVAALVNLFSNQREWLRRFAYDFNLKQKVVSKTTLFAGTCIGFIGNNYLRELEFDVCIVDEASKATATELLVPLSKSKRVVFVGDSRQLPPNDEELLRNKSVMEEFSITEEDIKSTLFDELSKSLPTSSQSNLSIQYRMDPPIGRLVSQAFYEGKLMNGPQITPNGLIDNLGPQVQWHDTSNYGESRREVKSKRSFQNKTEIRLVIQFLNKLLSTIQNGFTSFSRDYSPNILIIAPYAQQVMEIRRQLRIQSLNKPNIRVETIDAVQGLEADFAIISVTRSNPNRSFGFIGEEYWRRHNVALSRAKHGVYIFGDAEFVCSRNNGFKRALEHMVHNPNECKIVKETFLL